LGTYFTDTTTAEPFDEVVQSTWYWDDNGAMDVVSGSVDIVHEFSTLGVHNVKLTSITGNGCEDSIIKKVPIFEYITVCQIVLTTKGLKVIMDG
jgi:PKD repeat protein